MRLPTSSDLLDLLFIVGIVVLLLGSVHMMGSYNDCMVAGQLTGVETEWKFPGSCEVK